MKVNQPSLLRLFAINDQAFKDKNGEEGPPLRTNLIEIVGVSDGKGSRLNRLAQWLQHVHVLGTQEEPLLFDLMFIDIKFDEDPWAPFYCGERGKVKEGDDSDGAVNPLGLLHALTFASRQDPWGAPFVWGYHSGDPGSVKDDPIAIIVFSLLSALEQRVEDNVLGSPWKWDDVGLHKTPKYAADHFSNAIECLPRGGPEVIFDDMMNRYRQKVLAHVEDKRIMVEPEGLEFALQFATSGTEQDRQQLAKASIRLSNARGPRWKRDVLLQSLFADALIDHKDIWPTGTTLKSLREFLESLKEAGNVETVQSLVAKVDVIMRRVDNNQRSVLNGLPLATKKRDGAMAILCWWLSQKRAQATPDGHHFNTSDLLADFGYVPEGKISDEGTEVEVKKGSKLSNRGPLTRCLEPLGYKKLKDFFDYLETTEERMPSPYCDVGLFWWDTRCEGRRIPAPRCVRSGA